MRYAFRLSVLVLALALTAGLFVSVRAQFGTEMVYYELNKPKRNLLPTDIDDIRGIRLNELMFDALYGWNDRGEVDPQLAAGMPTLLDDSTRALVILKNNLLWPDSTPITVDDILFTFNIKRTFLKVNDTRRGLELIKDVRTGEAPNSILFKFVRKIQYPERLLAGIFIMEKKRMFDEGSLESYSQMPVGSGPYQLKDISITSNSYNLIKNANYNTISPGRPYIDRVKMTYWTSKAIWPVNILQGGIVHILPDMEYNTELSTKSQINAIPVNTNTVPMILFNERDPLLKNTLIRQGMQYLIPRTQICETIYMQDSTNVLTGPYPPSSFFFNYRVPAWDYNVELAQSLFTKSGLLSVQNGKIIRTDTGKQWDLTIVTYITAAGEEESLRKALESINNYFLSAGINSKIEYRSSEGYERALVNGNFQLIYLKVTLDDNFNIEPFFSTDAGIRARGQNYGKYSNPEVDKAFRSMLMTPDPDEQRRLGLTIHRLLHDDPPAMFLWNLRKYAYCRSELQDVSIDPFYFFSTVDKWSEKIQ
jgi:peptide/nickel transport system substrate-binding protein